jgi:hypothetical protein
MFVSYIFKNIKIKNYYFKIVQTNNWIDKVFQNYLNKVDKASFQLALNISLSAFPNHISKLRNYLLSFGKMV